MHNPTEDPKSIRGFLGSVLQFMVPIDQSASTRMTRWIQINQRLSSIVYFKPVSLKRALIPCKFVCNIFLSRLVNGDPRA